MCQSSAHRYSLQCIIPPHMLRSLIMRGTPEQRERALQNYGVSNSIRTVRAIKSALPVGRPLPVSRILPPHVQRTIYDTHNTHGLPGDVVRVEGQAPANDPTVNEAYDGLGSTFDFYWKAYQRNSIDDQGLPLRATVHYRMGYDNAFWDGSQMVFGDGDGFLFNRFTIALDVIAHELTHGVTQTDAELIYRGQSGALNESISDVFGSLVKQYARQETADRADWLIGEGLFTANVKGVALRSMKAPGTAYDDPLLGKDPQPAHMKDYVNTSDDNGGVHINSGIPNNAFYLVAKNIGGFAWEKAGCIWYNALRNPALHPEADFASFAQLTVTVADQLYGAGSKEEQIVRDAWNAVGVAVAIAPPILAAGVTNGHDGRRQGLKEALDAISSLLVQA